MGKNQSKSSNFIKQGTILAAASVLSRIIGLLYRSPMTAIIGDDSNGLYSYAFEVYSFALILSSYSMPLAVSKLLSAKFAKKEYENGYRIFKLAMIYASFIGALMMAVIFFAAPQIERFSGYEGLTLPLRVLSPTIFVVAVTGTMRGFFQSRKTMIPTAVSQVIEQIFNAAVSIFAAWLFVRFSNEGNRAGMGAAGGTMGTFAGAVTGLAFLIFLFAAYMPRMRLHLSHDCGTHDDTASEIGKMLAVTILPIILSQAVYQASGIIDGTLFGRLYTGDDKKVLVSIYSKYRTLINVPNAISSAMASSMIPTLVSFRALGNHKAFKAKLAVAVKVNMVIAFPCAVGLTVLGTPIMRMLFPSTDYIISGRMLLFGSIAVVFYALSTITNAALQGLDKMNHPVVHAAVSLAFHIALVAFLLKFTNLGIYALLIGTVTFPLVVCILNWISVGRFADYRQEVRTTFLIPAAASAVMGIITWLAHMLTSKLLGNSYTANFVSVVICMVIAVAVYFVMIFLLGGLKEKDMPDFPMGMRLARIARKLRILR